MRRLNSNLRKLRLLLTSIVLTTIPQPILASGSHCAFSNDEDWGVLRLGSASSAIDTVIEHCEPGDHLSVFFMRTHEVTYFIAYVCNPAFAINVIPLNENTSSVNCVYAGEKLDRFETCAHSSTPAC